MNRSILLVICDFLILSLFALADFSEPEQEAAEPELAQMEEAVSPEEDFIEILQASLESEQESKAALSQTLDQTREALSERDQALAEREAALRQKEATLEETARTAQELQEAKTQLEAERERLAREKAAAEAERQKLAGAVEQTRTRLEEAQQEKETLLRDLSDIRTRSAEERARMKTMQDELHNKQQALTQVAQELEKLEGEKRTLEGERQQLTTRLEVAETEKQFLSERVLTAEQQAELARREKEAVQETAQSLARGVEGLAGATEQISEEMKNLAPQSPNAIYQRFRDNLIRLRFETQRTGLFGEIENTYQTRAVPVTNGQQTWALFHSAGTPFAESRDAGRLASLSGILSAGDKNYRLGQVQMLQTDPRLLAVPLPDSVLEATGITAFPSVLDPSKYPEAVIIQDENHYGATAFQFYGPANRYLEMRRGIVNALQGQFNAGEGDFVFAKTGELIGVMANDGYAVTVQTFAPMGTLSVGQRFDANEAERLLKQRDENIRTLPRALE